MNAQQSATRLRKQAATMQKEIDKRAEASLDGKPWTRKRAQEVQENHTEAERLQRLQATMLALANSFDSGQVPVIMNGIGKDMIQRLIYDRDGKYPGPGWYRDAIEKSGFNEATYQPAWQFVKSLDITLDPAVAEVAKLNQLEAESKRLAGTITGYWPTPPALTYEMLAYVYGRPKRILEPSCGTGAILDVLRKEYADSDIIGVEKYFAVGTIAEQKGHNVIFEDFLELPPTGDFDLVVMNPPFEKNADCVHVMRAYEWLRPGGQLLSVMSPSWKFHSGGIPSQFRQWYDSIDDRYWFDLGPDRFKEMGTSTVSGYVVLRKE